MITELNTVIKKFWDHYRNLQKKTLPRSLFCFVFFKIIFIEFSFNPTFQRKKNESVSIKLKIMPKIDNKTHIQTHRRGKQKEVGGVPAAYSITRPQLGHSYSGSAGSLSL